MNINQAFNATCKVLFGREVGELGKFEEYLRTYSEQMSQSKTSTGKDVYYTAPYSKNARFISYEDAFSSISQPKFDIDDIKDVDSLLEVVRENCYYSGNKVIGKSEFVEKSENIADSSVVYCSTEILRCRYAAYSSLLRDSEYMFGSSCGGDSGFCFNVCENNRSQRSFETNIVFYSSDAYYSNNCKGCHDVFFCFDQRSKHNMIGNNQLEKGAYLKIKNSLLEQMANELEKKKRLPSLLEILGVRE